MLLVNKQFFIADVKADSKCFKTCSHWCTAPNWNVIQRSQRQNNLSIF